MKGKGEASGSEQARKRIVGRLPRIAVGSRAELADVLRRWRWLLVRRAVAELGETSAAREAVQSALVRLLQADPAAYPDHALRWALQTLRNECRAIRTRLERQAEMARRVQEAGGPVDPVLGPLVGITGVAVAQLTQRDKQVLFLAAEGLHRSDIAALLDEPGKRISMRLYRARRRAQAIRDQLLREGGDGGATGALLVWVPALRTRLRAVGSRVQKLTSRAATCDPTSAVSMAATPAAQLAALVVATLIPSVPVTEPGVVAAAIIKGSSAAPVVTSAGPGPAAREVPLGDGRGTPGTVVASGGPHLTMVAAPSGARPLSPSDETLEDTQLSTAAASKTGGPTPAIVALGVGHGCGCSVLFQSTDGGASWDAAAVPAPPDAVQVAIPPTYPRDPRIFFGSDPAGGAASYVAARFGAPAVPLPGGPGRLALAQDFDSGDARVFIAGRSAVVSVTVNSGVPRVEPLIAYPPGGGVASLATPGAGPAAVLILAPVGTVVAATSTLDAVSGTPSILACPRDQALSCRRQGDAPPATLALATPPSGPETAAVWMSGLGVSSDGEQSFVTIEAPAHAVLSTLVALSEGRVWATLTYGDQSTVAWTTGGAWHDASRSDPALRAGRWLFAAPGGRVLALLAGGGLRCTADGGTSWHDRCP